MILTTIDKLLFCTNIVLDVSLVGFIFTINNIDDISSIFKLSTSLFVTLVTAVRFYFLIKDRMEK